MRFLAEATWYPTVLLPSQGVQWEPVDDRSAYATLTEGSISVTMLFACNESGLIETVRVEARGRMVSGEIVQTPWQGRFWNYDERDHMRVPLDGEVAWLLPAGAKPYWRGRIIRDRLRVHAMIEGESHRRGLTKIRADLLSCEQLQASLTCVTGRGAG